MNISILALQGAKHLSWMVSPRHNRVLSILIYHQIFRSRDYLHPDEPTIEEFGLQMSVLKTCFHPLSLPDALAHLQNGTLPSNAVCVTFDDGYLDNFELALPVLEQWGIPATIFVATDYIGDGVMWNDRILHAVRSTSDEHWDFRDSGLGYYSLSSLASRLRAATDIIQSIKHLPPEERLFKVDQISALGGSRPGRLMMNQVELRSVSQRGITIGAHTRSHPILTSLEDDDARQEISGSKSVLESIIDGDIGLFAFPNGRFGVDFDSRHVQMAKDSGFQAAVTTDWGVADSSTNPFLLPRFTPWDKQAVRFYVRLLHNQKNVFGASAVGT